MSDELAGVLWTLLGTMGGAILLFLGNIVVKRMRNRASEPEVWRRLDDLTVAVYGGRDAEGKPQKGLIRTVESYGAFIRAVALQGPPAKFYPIIDPMILNEIDEDTIPRDHPYRQARYTE